MFETGRVPGPREVADRLAILDVLACHSRGVDRGDSDVLCGAYWPDATVEYGAFNGAAHTFCERLPHAMRVFRWTHHALGNVAMQIDGADARVETYVVARHYIEDRASGDREMTVFGRYLDRMQRRGDVWKIAHRRVVMDWNQHAAASAKWIGAPFDGLARGTRDRLDPLYPHCFA